MPRRSREQWLEMIHRTRPTAFAIRALEAEFARHAILDGLTESEVREIRSAIEKRSLEAQPAGTQLIAPSSAERPRASIEYRPHGSGGRGRLFIEIEGKTQLEPLENPVLDDLKVYVMTDGSAFAGLQVDDATELPAQLEIALEALTALGLPEVDCTEADLEGVRIAEVLAWAVEHRVLAGR